jgi:hypothetical protein
MVIVYAILSIAGWTWLLIAGTCLLYRMRTPSKSE